MSAPVNALGMAVGVPPYPSSPSEPPRERCRESRASCSGNNPPWPMRKLPSMQRKAYPLPSPTPPPTSAIGRARSACSGRLAIVASKRVGISPRRPSKGWKAHVTWGRETRRAGRPRASSTTGSSADRCHGVCDEGGRLTPFQARSRPLVRRGSCQRSWCTFRTKGGLATSPASRSEVSWGSLSDHERSERRHFLSDTALQRMLSTAQASQHTLLAGRIHSQAAGKTGLMESWGSLCLTLLCS